MTGLFPINIGSLPAGYCWTTPQDFANNLAQILTVGWNINFSLFNYGNSVPGVDDQDKPWIRLNTDGSLDRIYTFFNGSWKSPHPVAASSGVGELWFGTLGDIDTFDGGVTGTVGPTAGPFWAANIAMTDLFFVGAGNKYAQGTQGGSDTITPGQVPISITTGGSTGSGETPRQNIGFTTALPFVPQYQAGYFIQRTARIYYEILP